MYLVPGRQRAGQARRDEVMAEKEAVSDRETEPPYTEQAQLLRVMAHPVRLRVLEALAGRSQCVKDLNSLVPIVQPHLSVLREARRASGKRKRVARGSVPPASRKTGPVRRREGGGVLGAH